MPFFDEARDQLINWLNALDFSSAFPQSYAGTKAVTIVGGWPFDLIDNMLNETQGRMTVPVVSVLLANASDDFRSLGGSFGAGSTPTSALYATRVTGNYLVSVWADSGLGGAYTVEKIGGLVLGQSFVARDTLPSLRHLRVVASHEPYEERSQLWCMELTVEGDALVTWYG